MRNIITNEPQAIHRTALDEHGQKIDRKAMGPIGGGAIKLVDDEEVTLSIAVAEGIETALSIRNLPDLSAMPVWACISAGAMRSFPVLPGIEIALDRRRPRPSRHPRRARMCRPLASGRPRSDPPGTEKSGLRHQRYRRPQCFGLRAFTSCISTRVCLSTRLGRLPSPMRRLRFDSPTFMPMICAMSHPGRKWLHWTGTHWQIDDTLARVRFCTRRLPRSGGSMQQAKDCKALASAKTVNAVQQLAKADRRLAATVDQWDADPWLLNTPDGVLDLRTGQSRPHDPRDYMTKITAVSPNGDCPTWHGFLDRVTAGDRELQAFMQRMFGYALTGDTSATRCSSCMAAVRTARASSSTPLPASWSDYHRTAPIETFTASSVDRHPTDLAGLRGARLVTAVETEEGRRWAESRIKSLTGGDKIAARFMRQDFFEFTPQFKLVIAGNHKPGLRSVDEAIRRRFHLIPFTVTIPRGRARPDPEGPPQSRMARHSQVDGRRLPGLAEARALPAQCGCRCHRRISRR